MLSHFSCVQLFVTPWTVAHQAPLSMGFSRQEYWSGLPFPSPGNLPDPGIKPGSPALQADSLPFEPSGKTYTNTHTHIHTHTHTHTYIYICIYSALSLSFSLSLSLSLSIYIYIHTHIYMNYIHLFMNFPGGAGCKEPAC